MQQNWSLSGTSNPGWLGTAGPGPRGSTGPSQSARPEARSAWACQKEKPGDRPQGAQHRAQAAPVAQSLLHDEEARHRGQAGEPAPRPRTCLSRSSHRGRPAHRDDTPGRPTEQPSTPLGPRVTPSSPGRGGPTSATGGCRGPPPREGCGGAWRPAGLPRAVAHAVTDLSPRDAGPQPGPEGRLAWSPRSPRAWQPALSPQGTRNDALPPSEAPPARRLQAS